MHDIPVIVYPAQISRANNCWLCRFMALRWHNLPCALKAAIGYGKRTLGDPGSLPRHRGAQQG